MRSCGTAVEIENAHDSTSFCGSLSPAFVAASNRRSATAQGSALKLLDGARDFD